MSLEQAGIIVAIVGAAWSIVKQYASNEVRLALLEDFKKRVTSKLGLDAPEDQ